MTPTTQMRVLRVPLRARAYPSSIAPLNHRPFATKKPHSLQPSSSSSSPIHDPHAAINPPRSSLPPPLDLPVRDPQKNVLMHLFATGKAFLTFYKTGLKQVWSNMQTERALARGDMPAFGAAASTTATTTTTRAAALFRRRARHDVARLPLFALMLIVCGELTPLVVLAVPSAVPLTCRIPRQREKLLSQAETRRRRLRRLAGPGSPATTTTAHIARSLNLVSAAWDALGLPDAVVGRIAARKVRRRLAFLAEDTALLLKVKDPVRLLSEDELRLACEDRGLFVLGRSEAELRNELRVWLSLVAGNGKKPEDWTPIVRLLSQTESSSWKTLGSTARNQEFRVL